MGNLTSITGYLSSAAFLIFGIVICFSGYRLFKLSVTVAGAVIGYWAGSNIIDLLIKAADLDPQGILKTAVPLILAIVCGVLAFSFYRKAFIFVVAAFVTRIIFSSLKAASISQDFDTKQYVIVLLISMVVGLAIGIACFLIQKGAIIVVSGFGGATLIKTALIKYVLAVPFISNAAAKITTKLFDSHITPVNAVAGLLVLGFGIAGVIVQTKKRA